MQGKILIALVSMATIASLASPVRAQLPVLPESNQPEYQLTGDSLAGIDHRSSEDDFKKFFNSSISNNSESENQSTNSLRKDESISLPDNPQYLPLSQPNTNNNEALQLQLDLSDQ